MFHKLLIVVTNHKQHGLMGSYGLIYQSWSQTRLSSVFIFSNTPSHKRYQNLKNQIVAPITEIQNNDWRKVDDPKSFSNLIHVAKVHMLWIEYILHVNLTARTCS